MAEWLRRGLQIRVPAHKTARVRTIRLSFAPYAFKGLGARLLTTLLLPSEWKQGVAGAPLPDGDTVGDWIAFADQQTGKLDVANDRTKSAIGIVERCEARDEAAVKRATRRGFFGRLFG